MHLSIEDAFREPEAKLPQAHLRSQADGTCPAHDVRAARFGLSDGVVGILPQAG
jgi:hypothetical protein